ncbi:hypothetical protein [Streptomyces sp. NPDC002526]
MTFARSGAFLHLAAPDGRVWWSAQVASPGEPDLDRGDEAWLTHLAGLHRHERVPSAVLAATVTLHRPTPTHTLDPVTVRHDDRMVLLGDADHPVGAGQGASIALEDTLVLARSLGTETSVPAALAANSPPHRRACWGTDVRKAVPAPRKADAVRPGGGVGSGA